MLMTGVFDATSCGAQEYSELLATLFKNWYRYSRFRLKIVQIKNSQLKAKSCLCCCFRSMVCHKHILLLRQHRLHHGKPESFRATLWMPASHFNCPIYFFWWAFLICYRTSFRKRWVSINNKLVLTVSHIFPCRNPPCTAKSAKTQLQREPFQRTVHI